jgi:serine/threonine-protein kinase HipA
LLRIPQEDCCQALSVPPTRKYEPEGPGLIQILELLKTSDEPEEDQRLFLKAQIVYWLLGATDGHGKNFSLHLMPGGRFRLTPLYDIMSAQPYVDKGAQRRNQMKIAMAVGDSRHKVISKIVPRHFEQTARAAGVEPALVTAIFEELAQTVDQAIDQTLKTLPRGFSKELATSITRGLLSRTRNLRAPADTAH